MVDLAREGDGRYCLATIYFSGGYFGTRQAIQIDALRCAIDQDLAGNAHDQALAAFLVAVDRSLNSPGHSAQFLRPNGDDAFRRIQAVFARDVWETFVDALSEISPVGSARWRSNNEFRNGDALDLLTSGLPQLRAVYADPPYTKDQYSRYYHLHETLYRYDFPDSTGRGRYRQGRFTSAFSMLTEVEGAFASLFDAVSRMRKPLILSYPPDGLLGRRDIDAAQLAGGYFKNVDTYSFTATHSTMGASKGASSNQKVENIHVCTV